MIILMLLNYHCQNHRKGDLVSFYFSFSFLFYFWFILFLELGLGLEWQDHAVI